MANRVSTTKNSLLRVFVVQIESHPFITVGARNLSREPFMPSDNSGTIMERLAKTMDTSGVALELGNRYRDWHDMRHAAILSWIRTAIDRHSVEGSEYENLIVFPEGGVGRHQLRGLQAFVDELRASERQVTIVAGTHSFEFSRESLSEYPSRVFTHRQDPYYDHDSYNQPNEKSRLDELLRIARDQNFDTKQLLPIIHKDGSVSLRIKQFLSPFERTNTSQVLMGRASQDDERYQIPAFRLDHSDVNSYRVLPLVCSEALQFLQTISASVMCVVSNHARPHDFKHLNEQAYKNGIPAVLVNDGAFGGSGVFLIHDNRGENWWFAGANHAALPKGDAILVVDVDLECTSPQVSRANPRFPTGLSGLSAIVPASSTDSHCYISNELGKLRNYFFDSLNIDHLSTPSWSSTGKKVEVTVAQRVGQPIGIDYVMFCDTLESLIHSRRASPVQMVKLRRLLALAHARNLDYRSVDMLCDDCRFGNENLEVVRRETHEPSVS